VHTVRCIYLLHSCGVPTNLENLELSGDFVNLEKSGKSQGICDMVREFFYEMSHFSRVETGVGEAGAGQKQNDKDV